MRSIHILGAAALAFVIAGSASAQTAGSSSATTPSAAGPASAGAGATAGATAKVAVGQTVKDNTGSAIGQVTQVKPDASGREVATIKMGADSFAVDTSALAVENGAAVVNASQAEIKSMMKK
jgi:hypothetical protein